MAHACIPIQPLHGAAASCGGCLHGQGQPVCRATVGQTCAATLLSGPQDELQRVLTALGRRLGFAPEAPEQAGVRSLRIVPGEEVELRLALPDHCAGAERAETAFDTLRGLLPDTDIYVLHAA